jgi:hypothetical protein
MSKKSIIVIPLATETLADSVFVYFKLQTYTYPYKQLSFDMFARG